jgi:hypothetical protein
MSQPFDPNDPFGFLWWTGFAFASESPWLNTYGVGASATGGTIGGGQLNWTDVDEATVLQGQTPRNAAFVAWNNPGNQTPADGSILLFTIGPRMGLFARSTAVVKSIGVAGLADLTGCGVYGITGNTPVSSAFLAATGRTEPPEFFTNFGAGIGVAGQAMDGLAQQQFQTYTAGGGWLPLQFSDPFCANATSIGVAGISPKVGVRGHGGPLLEGLTLPELETPIDEARGGVFSAGIPNQLTAAFGADAGETVSAFTLAQLALIPFQEPQGDMHGRLRLPERGTLGELYATFETRQRGNDNTASEREIFGSPTRLVEARGRSRQRQAA